MKTNPAEMVPFEQIADDLRSQIRAGQFSKGDKMPSARELAVVRGVAPNTAARALRLLVDEGWAVSRGPVGTYVSESWDRMDQPITLAQLAADVAALRERVEMLERRTD